MSACTACRRLFVAMGRRLLDALMGAAHGAWRGREALRKLDDEEEQWNLAEAHQRLRASLKDADGAWADGEIDRDEWARWQGEVRAALIHVRALVWYDGLENAAHEQATDAFAQVRRELSSANETMDRALAMAEHRRAGTQPIAELIAERRD